MVKFVLIVLILLLVGAILAPYLPQVFGGFASAFGIITNNASDVIGFLVGLFEFIFNKPYLMLLVSCFVVFGVINLVINWFKGGK